MSAIVVMCVSCGCRPLEEPESTEFSDTPKSRLPPYVNTLVHHLFSRAPKEEHVDFEFLVPSLLLLRKRAKVVKNWTANWRRKSHMTSILQMVPT